MRALFFENFSIRKKFIIITSVAVILLMGVIGAMTTRRERLILYNNVELQGILFAETLAIPVMNDLIYERLGLVEEGGLIDNYITDIFKKKKLDLIYIAILDEQGSVISHNDFNEYGKQYSDSLTIKAITSGSTVVQKYHDDSRGHGVMDFATPLTIGNKRWGMLKFSVSLERVEGEVNAIIIRIFMLTLVFLLVGFIIIMILSRRFIEPITELAVTMESAGGDMLDVKADIRGRDEIALLGQSFNRMIARIREYNIELERTHDKLQQFAATMEGATGGDDMLDVKLDIEGDDEIAMLGRSFNSMIERIRESNLELKRTNEKVLQTEKLASIGILAAGVAHEINNPLGGMFNCLQMLDQQDGGNEFTGRYYGLLRDGLNKIETIVGKLLWTSRTTEKRPEPVDVQLAVDDIFRFVEYKLKEYNIIYSEKIERGLTVFIDPHDFQQCMINLMINAIQSMKDGGTLLIEAAQNESRVVVTMTDTGHGIGSEDLHKIFDPFYTTKGPSEGTGLGLWLTYEIIKKYKGEINVDSEVGKGSTLTMSMPLEGGA